MSTHRSPSVGNTLVSEIGRPFVLVWTVSKVSTNGRQATVRSPGQPARQIFRTRFDSWRFGSAIVVFSGEADPRFDAPKIGTEVRVEGDRTPVPWTVASTVSTGLLITRTVEGSSWSAVLVRHGESWMLGERAATFR